MVKIQEGQYSYVNLYQIPINGRDIGFYTLVSRNGIIAWMPNNEQQNVNIGYNGAKGPAKLGEVSQIDVVNMLGQVLTFQTKKQLPLDEIVKRHMPLIEQILEDLTLYHVLSQLFEDVIPKEQIKHH